MGSAAGKCECFEILFSRTVKDEPVVKLSTGYITGEYLQGGIAWFSGVPFAIPPTGQRRWKKPQAAQPWGGFLDCSSRRSDSERKGISVQEQHGESCRVITEDCLHLDLWIPEEWACSFQVANNTFQKRRKSSSFSLASFAGAPVLVWIHGGALLGGSKDHPGSSGYSYADRGVIFVAINYRVGALGFLRPHGADANCGLWDQVAALRWIQAEIHNFGGDPARVTIMGQSAGADCAYWLSSSRLANKLFARAILMSPSSFAITLEQASDLADEFAARARLTTSDLTSFQALPAEVILHTQIHARFRAHPTTGPGWREMTCEGSLPPVRPEADPLSSGIFQFPYGYAPKGWPIPVAVVDGELLEEQPLTALSHGVASHLDVVIGGCTDENAFQPRSDEEPHIPAAGCCGRWVPTDEETEALVNRFAWEIAGAPAVRRSKPEELENIIRREVLPAYMSEIAARQDLNRTGSSKPHLNQMLQNMIATDFSFLAKVQLICERLAPPGRCKKLYRYQFDGFGAAGNAFHGSEMEMVKGVEGDGVVRKAHPKIRRQWLDSWSSFSASGDPDIPEMDGAWKEWRSVNSPIMIWDGLDGWRADGKVLVTRKGLLATARLWERLWQLEAESTCRIT